MVHLEPQLEAGRGPDKASVPAKGGEVEATAFTPPTRTTSSGAPGGGPEVVAFEGAGVGIGAVGRPAAA
ncbi:MAG: hypothetical protein ACKVVT_13360 [Dehalococcoidia bacterium]